MYWNSIGDLSDCTLFTARTPYCLRVRYNGNGTFDKGLWMLGNINIIEFGGLYHQQKFNTCAHALHMRFRCFLCVENACDIWFTHVIMRFMCNFMHIQRHVWHMRILKHMLFCDMCAMFAMNVLHAWQETCMSHMWSTCNTCVPRYMIKLHISGIFVLVYYIL